ncbi:MAG: TRAP transporter small permease subunit [Deltaproteobacteria bacterium]|nr:TRAP transporter small permease subunit [Deltaproteobacteria bacterium]
MSATETGGAVTEFLNWVYRLSKGLYTVAGITLTFIMIVTVTDVILRFLGRPIVGVYELVAFSGAIVIGFSIPFTSWVRGHIYVDFLLLKLSPAAGPFFSDRVESAQDGG